MDNLTKLNSLSEARKIVRDRQFDLAGMPAIWNLLNHILRHIDKQQEELIIAIRES
jgi:hypothetical protein